MKETFLILRNDRLLTSNVFNASPATAAATPKALRADVIEVDRKDIPAISRDASVEAVAPAVPMKLVAPLDVHEATPAQAGDIAWGVRAVRADS